VIVPLLSMQQSCLLCISTLLESGNHYSRMFELKDQLGAPLFETISITLVCDECMRTDRARVHLSTLVRVPLLLPILRSQIPRTVLISSPSAYSAL
jgi:hypothetical protein